MTTFGELFEIFDSKLPIEKTTVTHHYDGSVQKKQVHFGSVDGKQKYIAHIFSDFDHNRAEISFHDHNEEDHITNRQRDTSHRVISTVKHIAQEHMRKYPEIESLRFSARSQEPSRVKLYRSLVKSVALKHSEETPTSITHFTVNRKDMK